MRVIKSIIRSGLSVKEGYTDIESGIVYLDFTKDSIEVDTISNLKANSKQVVLMQNEQIDLMELLGTKKAVKKK